VVLAGLTGLALLAGLVVLVSPTGGAGAGLLEGPAGECPTGEGPAGEGLDVEDWAGEIFMGLTGGIHPDLAPFLGTPGEVTGDITGDRMGEAEGDGI